MASKGQKVKAHYRGTLDDGTVFDSSYDRGEPIEFVAGAGQMIPGFDKAVLEMEVGEKRTVHIPAAEAYGEHDQSNVAIIPLDVIPNAEQLPVGEFIVMPAPNGQPMRVKVAKIEDGKVHLDANHELAGKALNFEIELISAD
jgi:FKBP-type peptidyl-prolyl cis-trans isomerase 2